MEVNHTDSVHPAVARQTPGHEQESLGTSPGCSCQLTPPRIGERRVEEEKLTGVCGTAAAGRPVLVIERFISPPWCTEHPVTVDLQLGLSCHVLEVKET